MKIQSCTFSYRARAVADRLLPIVAGAVVFVALGTLVSPGASAGAASHSVTTPPPTTRVVLPSNGAMVIGGTYLDAVASSPGIASVKFEVSGDEGLVSDKVISSSVPTSFGWFGGWDATDVPNGRYTLQSVATNTMGRSTTSAGIGVTVDNDRLRSAICVPSSGVTVAKSPTLLDAWATGKVDVTKVQYIVSRGSFSDDGERNGRSRVSFSDYGGRGEGSHGSLSGKVVATATQTGVGWIALWNITGVPSGTYTLRSVATDLRGATATSDGIKVSVGNSTIHSGQSEAGRARRFQSDLESSGCFHPSTDIDRQDHHQHQHQHQQQHAH